MKRKMCISEFIFLILVFGTLTILSMQAVGAEVKLSPMQLKAIYTLSKQNGLNSDDLLKIAYVESKFNMQAIRYNKNGSIDYGMFQINSVHWNTTCKKYDIFTYDGNLKCAVKLIMSHKKHMATDPNWISRYHSATPKYKAAYARQLANVDLYHNGK